MGFGSLYISIIFNLFVEGIVDVIKLFVVLKVYIVNIMI